MANSGSIPGEATGKLQWLCGDLNCSHTPTCKRLVMWSDSGETEIRGEMVWNEDDRKWDWSVAVDHYGSSDMSQSNVEAMTARHARRMATQVGVAFRGRKLVSLYEE